MTFDELEIVALTHDVESHGLSDGDTGTIVEVYNNGNAYEVEFIDDNGRTIALLTLTQADITKESYIRIKSKDSVDAIITLEKFNNILWIRNNKNDSSTQSFYASV